jgi:hypothetical protein
MDGFNLGFDVSIKVFYQLLTLLFFFYVLRYRDKLVGIEDFKEKFKGVVNDPKAFANYLGITAIAVAIIFSRF